MKLHPRSPLFRLVSIASFAFMLAVRMLADNFTNLYSFTATSTVAPYTNSDGGVPDAELTLSGDTLYGTAVEGGISGFGTVFKVNTDGTGFAVLHSFASSSDGAYPVAGLVLGESTLYGTTSNGGDGGAGEIFALKADGTGFTNMHSFMGRDGAYPDAGLTLSGNTLYGTANGGGSAWVGTVFKVNIDGSGFTTLHSFTATSAVAPYTNSDGAYPSCRLILSGNTLYGTAANGGRWGNGTVFAVQTDGTGFTNLYSFGPTPYPYKNNSDGAEPISGLILGSNTLYGTTTIGGSNGDGTVFKVNTDGTGFTILHKFTRLESGVRTNRDGANPQVGLVLLGDALYGTTTGGGNSGMGTVFRVGTNGTGFMTMHSFTLLNNSTNIDGAYPHAALILSGNALYGTAMAGGSAGSGTVFSLSSGLSPPTINCSTPLVLECTNGAAVGTVQAAVQDTNGNPLQVVWTVDGTASQTNNIPSGGNITASNVTFTANFGLGEHVVVVSASNGQTDPITCSTTVIVHDTTPPRIVRIVATPNVLWPPNHRMVPVNLMVEAADNCDPAPVVRITNVTSNEPQNPFAPDWEITGAQSLNLRAERLGEGQGRVYTVVVECKDGSGNLSTASVDVTVPHN